MISSGSFPVYISTTDTTLASTSATVLVTRDWSQTIKVYRTGAHGTAIDVPVLSVLRYM